VTRLPDRSETVTSRLARPRLGGVPGHTLTPRERAVLAAVGRRLSNSEIAAELFISVRTVESHIAALRRKLGADSRADLIAAAGSRRGAAVRVPGTVFVGRERELAELHDRLTRHRWATVAGPGGVGKTRLALEYARTQDPDRTPLVVELEHAGPEDVVARIARAVELESARNTDLRTAVGLALAAHPTLLVLDNVDRVGDEVHRVVDALTGNAPDLHVITTSRTPLGTEPVLHIDPLATDGPAAAGVVMFLDRLDRSGRAPSPGDRELAEEVCRRVEGLPLAIELAAGAARHLSLAELADRLDRDFAMLDRASPAGRHRTLETAFAWTWDLLSDDEREVMCRLAALPRTFDVDLATAVTHPGAEGVLLRLLDHSMLVPASASRFRVLAVMREFVHARTDPALIRDVLERHAEYYAAVARHFVRVARVDDSPAAMSRSALLCPEVNAALRWALAAEHPTALSLASSLAVGIEQYGSDADSVHSIALAARDERVRRDAAPEDLLALGIALCYLDVPLVDELAELALEAAEGGDDRAKLAAHHLAGMSDAYRDRETSAVAHLDEAERIALRLGEDWELAATRQMRGIALRDASSGNPAAAIAEFEAAMHGYAVAGDAMHVNNARYMMAITAAEHGMHLDEAAAWAAECVDYATRVGNTHELAHATLVQQMLRVPDAAAELDELADMFRRLGDARCLTRSLIMLADRRAPAEALAALEEALHVADVAGDEHHQRATLERLAKVYWSIGDVMRARTALGRLEAIAGPDAASEVAAAASPTRR